MLDGSTRVAERQDAASATRGLLDGLRGSPTARRVGPTLDTYTRAMAAAEAADKRARYAALVNQFYDLVTDFYEYGWGQSFNFVTRFKGETMPEATACSERELAMRLGLRPESRVLDVGCGVGGPMRSIARVSGAQIVGINNNDYQIGRAEAHNRALGLDRRCTVRRGDFMALPFEPESFDVAYAVAATCHAPSLEGVYAEVRRVLKPGGRFACVEWCTTARFDPDNHEHCRLREAVAAGNGLVAVLSIEEALAAARGAEFDVLEAADLALTGDIPWYEPLAPRGLSVASFRSSKLGRWSTNQAVGALELLHMAPRGARAVACFLSEAADALVEAGQAGIFTPVFLMLMQKPSR